MYLNIHGVIVNTKLAAVILGDIKISGMTAAVMLYKLHKLLILLRRQLLLCKCDFRLSYNNAFTLIIIDLLRIGNCYCVVRYKQISQYG